MTHALLEKLPTDPSDNAEDAHYINPGHDDEDDERVAVGRLQFWHVLGPVLWLTLIAVETVHAAAAWAVK